MKRLKLLFCIAMFALAAGAQDSRSICLLLDLRSMNADNQARAQTAALQFVETKVTASDQVSVMTFSSEIKVIQDFSGDRDAVIAALRKVAPSTASNSGDVASKSQAIQAASKILEPVAGKKQLLYFYGDVAGASDSQPQVPAAIDAAVRANVAIYNIDVRK
jgi:VWFA-related protein